MKEYKYIHFYKLADNSKTSIWSCRNNKTNTELGKISWCPAWRQYCYYPNCEAVYSAGCLDDISDFIKTAMKDMVKKEE